MLVNLPESANGVIYLNDLPNEKFTVEVDSRWKSVLQTANRFRLEADVNSLCLIFGSLTSGLQNREGKSPLLIIPLNWQYQRITIRNCPENHWRKIRRSWNCPGNLNGLKTFFRN
ncbi:hypothetical protein D3C80_1395490 [compost metagenome]